MKHRNRIDKTKAFLFYCTALKNGKLPSYDDVAKEFAVTKRAIELIGTTEKWVELRQSFGKKQIEIFQLSNEERVKKINERQFEKWQALEEFLWQIITRMQDDFNNTSKVDYLGLKQVSNTLKMAADKQRIILGLPTEVNKAEIREITEKCEITDEEIREIDAAFEKLYRNT